MCLVYGESWAEGEGCERVGACSFRDSGAGGDWGEALRGWL